MTQLLSLEFLAVVLFIMNLFLMILLVLIVKRVNQLSLRRPGQGRDDPAQMDLVRNALDQKNVAAVSKSAQEIMDMLAPLVRESKDTAAVFDEQIREKRALSKKINDALDSRIISVNLLLSRAETLHEKLSRQQDKVIQNCSDLSHSPSFSPGTGTDILDQQEQILNLYYQQVDIDTIAQKLSIPKGEVQLVINLKEKFLAMEETK